MNTGPNILDRTIRQALSGKGAHAGTKAVFDSLDWHAAGTRPEGVPHSLYQLLNHMLYWQDWVVQWAAGKNPSIPEHASAGWPGAASPATREDWEAAVKRFRSGLAALRRRSADADLLAKSGKKTRLEMLQTIAAHNSYHAGQAVLLRQMLGAWPPPSGGLTW